MGLGDEILALGRCESYYERTGEPACIVSAMGAKREHDAWLYNPAYNFNADKHIIDGGGARPYLISISNRISQFNMDYKARAGRIHLTSQERKLAEDMPDKYAIVAPHIKANASPNKLWSIKNWRSLKFDIPVYQLTQGDEEVMPYATSISTKHFRHACAFIEKARFVVCQEGGTHHMAASMGTKAIVLWGGFVPPSVTGYNNHVNIIGESKGYYCGKWDKCNHCIDAMNSITVERVNYEIQRLCRL